MTAHYANLELEAFNSVTYLDKILENGFTADRKELHAVMEDGDSLCRHCCDFEQGLIRKVAQDYRKGHSFDSRWTIELLKVNHDDYNCRCGLCSSQIEPQSVEEA